MTSPTLVWFRRDLRLSDHAALIAAAESGPVVPVFVRDASVTTLGSAPRWRLGLGIETLSAALEARGSRLVLRSGNALDVLRALIAETGARAVHWSRLYDPASVTRDTEIKSSLRADGITARSFGGHLMFEPWSTETKTGGFYKVYTPFWKSVRTRDVDAPRTVPSKLAAPAAWPSSEALGDWALDSGMKRGAAVVRPFLRLGEEAARERLAFFIDTIVAGYDASRDRPDKDGTSGLSENLALGEISPHQCWHAGLAALHAGKPGAETFLKELVWREFAYHLMHHTPHILDQNWKPGWDDFPWNTDPGTAEVRAWQQGRTGIRFVDAAMRELYVTGRMHNRGRMIVASYLTKHLQTHWKIGLDWFADCLTDWDPASNAMGWQWSSGSGPDATPYFRVFNPVTQLDKFDPQRAYSDRWIAEGKADPHRDALQYFDAIPTSWGLRADMPYPGPVVAADVGRTRALDAYAARSF